MSLSVREVDLDSEMPTLVDVFNRGFNVNIPESRFDWLYRRNPEGPATAWFVVDERTGDVAGCTAVSPRRIQVRDHSEVVGWNCGDFCVMPKYRAGAAAIKLRRAAKDAIDAGQTPFLYAHPNDRMLQIHVRVGHQPLGRMIRLARPTRVPRPDLIGRVATSALRLARWDRLARGDECSLVKGELPRELDDVFDRARPQLGTALVRDVRYLSWRFRDCPTHKYSFLLTQRGSQLTGYLVFCFLHDKLNVRDWLGVDARAVRSLFRGAVDQAIAADTNSASVALLETHRDVPLIRSLGFTLRPEQSTSITYASEQLPWRTQVTSADAWYMTVGDRDI